MAMKLHRADVTKALLLQTPLMMYLKNRPMTAQQGRFNQIKILYLLGSRP